VGKYAADFEDAAFALNKPGEISAPLVTEYGIHLLKLISKTPLQPFDSIKEMVTRRVENDSRASVAKEVYQEKIKKEYGYKTYDDNFQKLMAALPATINKENPLTTEKYSHMQSPLFELKGQKYTQSQFINYVVNITRGNIMGNKENTFRDLLKMYENSIMSETQQTELENKNAEYRALVNEYKDGMLLFELTDRNVWSKASKDTVGLAQYFENNRQKYTWKPGFEGTVYQSASEVDLNRLKSDLDKGGDANEAWKALNESEHPIKASQQSGHFENFKFATDLSQLKENSTSSVFRNTDGTYTLVRALKTFSSPTNKTYEEAKGFVVADYQDYLEQNWIKGLKAKYPVKVEEKVLKTMIK
jgi:peptidyl-prolyl cis-trans isomerase SurA